MQGVLPLSYPATRWRNYQLHAIINSNSTCAGGQRIGILANQRPTVNSEAAHFPSFLPPTHTINLELATPRIRPTRSMPTLLFSLAPGGLPDQTE